MLDNLIYRGELQVMIAAFIDPGKFTKDGASNRHAEYTLPTPLLRVIVDALLPRLYTEYRITRDPERHAIAGWSSGAIAAFTVAWERPDQFRKVLSGIGTYVNLAGGHVYPEKVMASERKPIRIFMIDGRNDNRGVNADGQYDQTRDWFYQNVRLRRRCYEGLDVNYPGARVPATTRAVRCAEMMRWLWRDLRLVDPNDTIGDRQNRKARCACRGLPGAAEQRRRTRMFTNVQSCVLGGLISVATAAALHSRSDGMSSFAEFVGAVLPGVRRSAIKPGAPVTALSPGCCCRSQRQRARRERHVRIWGLCLDVELSITFIGGSSRLAHSRAALRLTSASTSLPASGFKRAARSFTCERKPNHSRLACAAGPLTGAEARPNFKPPRRCSADPVRAVVFGPPSAATPGHAPQIIRGSSFR